MQEQPDKFMDQAAFKKAVSAFESEHYSEASAAFEALYQEQQVTSLNHYLVASLYHDQQFLAAEQYAAETDASYLSSQRLFELRLQVALANQQFIFAREFVNLPAVKSWRAKGLAEIAAEEQVTRQSLAAKQRVIAKQFSHLGDVSFGEQRRRYERAKQLPLKEFMQGLRFLLVDPFLHPLMKATLLEELMRLRVADTVQLTWIDGTTASVATNDLEPVGKSQAAQTIQRYLQVELGQQDPVKAAGLQQTVTLQLMMLYPYIDRVITSPLAWIQNLAGRPLDPEVTSGELKAICDWQRRLEGLIADLLGQMGPESAENPEKP
ncbi:hypothetical protein ACFQET_03835 [Levilactobacillus tangyuanensis]|uniref:TPR repeat-containing protein n=1 Tax=Levilactobacillus tangyuanensis TaxID=2486021 RepID=A0ABW1TNC7_9LACO|nr:hypothetical protein [Levilactobacillus tangyuanensis]